MLLLAGLLAMGCGRDEAVPEPLPATAPPAPSGSIAEAVEQEAPDVALPTLDGDSTRLADYRGEVVLVQFWATWCAPCRTSVPDLIRLHEAYAAAGLHIVGIALDEAGAEAVRPFADDLALPYTIAFDDGTVAGAFGGSYSLPTSFLVDRSGGVRHRLIGAVTRAQLEPLIAALLAEPAPTAER